MEKKITLTNIVETTINNIDGTWKQSLDHSHQMAVKPAWLWNRKGTESGLIKLRVRGVYWARQQRSVVFILYIYMFFVCFYLYLMSNIACRFVFISYICWADEHDVLCLDSEFVFAFVDQPCMYFIFICWASKQAAFSFMRL